uniref:Uncharacterized protein n=1 Tax=Glossina austeni TaxID=7395 RepID=A0A1A9VC01_GLOAU
MINLTLVGFAFCPFAWFTAIMNKYYLEPFTLAFMITEKETLDSSCSIFYLSVSFMDIIPRYHQFPSVTKELIEMNSASRICVNTLLSSKEKYETEFISPECCSGVNLLIYNDDKRRGTTVTMPPPPSPPSSSSSSQIYILTFTVESRIGAVLFDAKTRRVFQATLYNK